LLAFSTYSDFLVRMALLPLFFFPERKGGCFLRSKSTINEQLSNW
jgi:hypothetical protein